MTKKKEKEIKNEEIEEVASKSEEAEEISEETEPVEKTVEDVEKELNDKYLRLYAEFDNFKKRTQKEKISIYTDAAADVVEAVLPMLDNLERASKTETTNDEAKSVLEGILLIKKQFEEILKNIGVTEIEALGKEFDPNYHNAVMHIDDETIDGNDIVIEEFQKGYMYRDKVVRHSTVKVAN